MPRKTITFESVREMCRDLPGVDDGTAYGAPAITIYGKMMACIPTHKSAEPDSLAVRIDFDRRQELLDTDPDVYYVKDHYLNYPMVLVRLNRIHADALRGLLNSAWRFVTAKPPRAPRGRKR